MEIAGILLTLLEDQDAEFTLSGAMSATLWSHPLAHQTVLLIGEKHVADPETCPRPMQTVRQTLARVLRVRKDCFFDVLVEVNRKFQKSVEPSPIGDVLTEFQDCQKTPTICPYPNVRVHWTDLRADLTGESLIYLEDEKGERLKSALALLCKCLRRFDLHETDRDVARERFSDAIVAGLQWESAGRGVRKQLQRVHPMFEPLQKPMMTAINHNQLKAQKALRANFDKIYHLAQTLFQLNETAMSGLELEQALAPHWKSIKQFGNLFLDGEVSVMDTYVLARLHKRFKVKHDEKNLHPEYVQNAVIMAGDFHIQAYNAILHQLGYIQKWAYKSKKGEVCIKLRRSEMERVWIPRQRME